MKFKINNRTGFPIDYKDEIQSLCDFGKERLGFQNNPTIFLNHDQRNADQTYGKTGYYDPQRVEIHVFATGRHPKDILRSIAHELVHHGQNERGELENAGYSGPGYAQKNPSLRKAETEANDPMFFRDFEDWTKANKSTNYNQRRKIKMSLKEWKNKEMSGLLTEKWGFKMNLGKLNEAAQAEPGEEAKKANFDDDDIKYSRKEVEMHAKKGNESAKARLKKMDAEKLNEAEEEESDDEVPVTDDTREPEEGEDDSGLTPKQEKYFGKKKGKK